MLPLTLKALQATFVTQGGGETFWAPAPLILMPERWESKRWKAKALLYKNELFFAHWAERAAELDVRPSISQMQFFFGKTQDFENHL